jgi:hypothetical protein
MQCNFNIFRGGRHVGTELRWAERATAQDYDMLGEVELVDAAVSARSSFIEGCIGIRSWTIIVLFSRSDFVLGEQFIVPALRLL